MENSVNNSKVVEEESVMHSKSDNIEFMPDDNAIEVDESLLSRYQIGLETSIKESDFIFDSVQLLYYKCHKINFKRSGSFSCFQYGTTMALNFEEIKKDPQIVSNIKPVINDYNLEGISHPSKIEDWKRFEKNNLTIALNILYIKKDWHYLAVTNKEGQDIVDVI